MGACTSAARYRKKHHRQLYKRSSAKNVFVLDNKQVSSAPLTVLPNQQSQRPRSLLTDFDVQSSPLKEPVVYKTDTNSLIQLYSSNLNNNNSNRNSWMSSSSSSTSHPRPRIPVPKTRLPAYQAQSSSSAGSIRSKNVTTTTDTTNRIGTSRPMSLTNRSSLPSSSHTSTQPRLGCIPRPAAPVVQQTQASSLPARSRSISPSSTASANSSSSFATQQLAKTSSIRNRSTAAGTSKSKMPPSSRINKDAPSTTTTTNRPRLSTPSRVSNSPLSPTTILPTKTDVNGIRDRYKASKRINFFTRRSPMTNLLKSPSIEPSVIVEEKNEQLSIYEATTSVPNESQNDDLTIESGQQADSAYASTESPTNHPSSAQRSQATRYRHRAPSTLSSSSALSNVLYQDGTLDDDNCSLKSDDLICDYDETLTLDSVSKTNRTNSSSSNSLSLEMNKKSSMIASGTATKTTISPVQPSSKESRPTHMSKYSPSESTQGNLRESLDELSRLSNRMDNVFDHEHHRLLTRSVSLKPPPTSLPPREDGEQITMDIESYRQVMKDVMVVKTILHQLDRLLKHSDGANMTDSMIGSFHDSMVTSRHQSVPGDGNLRHTSIDENSSYDDLAKELLLLRKEREQDKQTIKLLQEQMYKYSSQTNG